MSQQKYVYMFTEGRGDMRNLLGGKGANLAEMTNIGLPVPQGFTISTEACTRYYNDGELISKDIEDQIKEYLQKLEETTGKKFGDPDNYLLVSVRSGSRASMPGMMDTVLNLGINDAVAEGLSKHTNNPRFAYDSYRRFIQMFSDVVMELEKSEFEKIITAVKEAKGVKLDSELDADDMRELVSRYKAFYKAHKGTDFPSDPYFQLIESIKAVFRSWNNERAIIYRRMNDIPGSWGTAVNVQSMVFGNLGNDSGTGVAFTRNPSTGENKLYGEYLFNAQGEDVVAGVRSPQPIAKLAEEMPEVYNQFAAFANRLEQHYQDMQDMEFTIERGKLYMLQTRNGKRTAQAAIKIAVDMVKEGLNTKEQAVMKMDPRQLDALLHPCFEDAALKAAKVIGSGLAASPGAATGKVYFTAEKAVEIGKTGEKVIIVRQMTSPEDIEGMNIAQGILTVQGGTTSHAAVVARGMGKCCVCGCGEINLNEDKKVFTLGGETINEGDFISLNGSTGKIYLGCIPMSEASVSGDFGTVMGWVEEIETIKVRANADTPKDAQNARDFGAKGIGLCRTEHMFFDADRIGAMREMIVSDNIEQRKRALAKLEPIQKADFEGIFRVMEGLPVTIRLLDPPLHEFLPHDDDSISELAKEMGITFEALKFKIETLHESNPMLGHRGCRLAVSYPEIYAMQASAIIDAAVTLTKEGITVIPEIMIPLVGDALELKFVKKVITDAAEEVIKASGVKIDYLVGTMIEVPRAALTADEIAEHAQFFSFGTNDLTQMTYGFSRDDAAKFLDDYYKNKVFESDPFVKLDQSGVGLLIKMAYDKGHATRPDLKVGLCGEQGADPASIEFCYKTGLSYVSCSPFRVPVARLAAAQAALRAKR